MFKNKIQTLVLKSKNILDNRMKDAFKWSFIGQVLSRFINLISTIVLARIMLPEGYGKYIYIIGTLIFFSQLMSLSIKSTTTRNVAFLINTDKEKVQKYIFISLLLGLFFAFTGYIILLLVVMLFQNKIIVIEYTVIILSIAFSAIISEITTATILGILEGVKSFKSINLSTIFISILKFIFSYLGFMFYGIEGAIIGWIIASFIGLYIFYTHLNQTLKINNIILSGNRISECKEELKLFFNFSIPSSIETGIILFSMWLIQTFILEYGDIGKKEIAMFNIASQWKYLIIYLPAILINMLQSFLSEFNAKDEKENAEDLFKKTKKVIILVSVILCLLFILIAKWVISFYGENYADAYFVLIILILPITFTNISALNRQYLMSQGKVWYITINNLLASLSVIAIFLILINYFSLSLSLSFAIAVGIREVLIFIIYWIIFNKITYKKILVK